MFSDRAPGYCHYKTSLLAMDAVYSGVPSSLNIVRPTASSNASVENPDSMAVAGFGPTEAPWPFGPLTMNLIAPAGTVARFVSL